MKNINDFHFALNPKPGGEDIEFLFQGHRIYVKQFNGTDPVLKRIMPGKKTKTETNELLIIMKQGGSPDTQHVCSVPKAMIAQSGDDYKHGLFEHLVSERKKYLLARPYA